METMRGWMGSAEVRPLRGADAELEGATYVGLNVFDYATSREEFERGMMALIADENLELVDLDAVGPVHEMLNVDEDKLNCAIESATSGGPSLLFHSSFEPIDVDEDWATVCAAAAAGDVVRFRLLGLHDTYYSGFVVAISDTLALIHRVDVDVVTFDGYLAVPSDIVIDASVVDNDQDFVFQALALRGEDPRDPGVPLDNLRALVTALSDRYPVVGLKDKSDLTGMFFGRVTTIEKHKVTLRGIDRAGEWVPGRHDHLYKDIAMIAFDGGYETALASVVR